MARLSRSSRLNPRLVVPVAPAGAALAAGAVALACLVAPERWLTAAVVRSGLPALLPAATPPLGWTARGLLALAGAGGLAAVMWAALVLVLGERHVALALPGRRRGADGMSAVRRADQHPDAPPRAPILAGRDFGPAPAAAPALPDGRALPENLDTPLVPYAHAEPPAPEPAPRERVPLAPGERIASVELTADTRDEPASLEALLARLERGAREARPVRPAPRAGYAATLEEALGTLRSTAAA